MIKLLGIGILLAIAGYSAWIASGRERRRLAVLEAWITLLYYVRSQIDCFSLPVAKILSSAERSVLETLGATHAVSLEELFHASLPYLDKESAKSLENLIAEMGSTYRQEQVKRIDYYLRQLETARDKMRLELPKRVKMLVTLHLCVGIGSAILLW